MNIDPGKLNKSIEIYEREPGRDSDGYHSGEKKPVHKCMAMYSALSGTELIKAGADFGEVKVRFLIRHTKKPLSRKMTVLYAKKEFEIEYINTYGDGREYIELWCKRKTLEG